MPKVLLVDDEEAFRGPLAERLALRGFEAVGVGRGDDAVKAIRADREIDVVLLDRQMPGMSGEQTLREIKAFRPELQVIMLTAHGSLASATEAGKLDAFAYREKPVDIEELIRTILEAREERERAVHRYEAPPARVETPWRWLLGTHNSRPLFILLGAAIFVALLAMPTPARLSELIGAPKSAANDPAQPEDINRGYATYLKMAPGENIAGYYSAKQGLGRTVVGDDGGKHREPLSVEQTALRARVMLAVLFVSALFWASGAIPVGVTTLFVGAAMYLFDVLKPDDIAQAFAKDAVIFIFGVLALAAAIGKTGLDRRIGLLLLTPAKSLPALLFVFLPLLSVSCAFVSEHALIAFLTPLFVMIYASSVRASGLRSDPALMTLLVLSTCFAANVGGPGSPAAGGRNAVMIGILTDYGIAPTFGEWVKYGLPFVPVASLAIGAYFYLVFRSRIRVRSMDVSKLVREAADKIGPANRDEYIAGATLIGVIVLWVTASDRLGMGGPAILGLLALNLLRVLRWRDIASIHWEVVFLYAGATAIGKGLAVTGAALYMADTFVGLLPEAMLSGVGLAIATSLFTGLTTNFMSDGATVAAIGPITVPMAKIAATHPWMIGFATAFASSFAHMLIIGTPNNAIAYAMARDPHTGEQLVGLGDFFKHGAAALLISFAVLWGWTFLGYWRWIGF